MPLADVRPRHLLRLVEKLRAEGALAPRTVLHVYATLRMMFKAAVVDEVISTSPAVLGKGQRPLKRDKDPAWRARADAAPRSPHPRRQSSRRVVRLRARASSPRRRRVARAAPHRGISNANMSAALRLLIRLVRRQGGTRIDPVARHTEDYDEARALRPNALDPDVVSQRRDSMKLARKIQNEQKPQMDIGT